MNLIFGFKKEESKQVNTEKINKENKLINKSKQLISKTINKKNLIQVIKNQYVQEFFIIITIFIIRYIFKPIINILFIYIFGENTVFLNYIFSSIVLYLFISLVRVLLKLCFNNKFNKINIIDSSKKQVLNIKSLSWFSIASGSKGIIVFYPSEVKNFTGDFLSLDILIYLTNIIKTNDLRLNITPQDEVKAFSNVYIPDLNPETDLNNNNKWELNKLNENFEHTNKYIEYTHPMAKYEREARFTCAKLINMYTIHIQEVDKPNYDLAKFMREYNTVIPRLKHMTEDTPLIRIKLGVGLYFYPDWNKFSDPNTLIGLDRNQIIERLETLKANALKTERLLKEHYAARDYVISNQAKMLNINEGTLKYFYLNNDRHQKLTGAIVNELRTKSYAIDPVRKTWK